MNDIKPEIINEQEISMFELKNLLSNIKKRDEELNFRFNRTEEYLGAFVTLNNKEGKALIDNLKKLDIPRLKDAHICKIVDILPITPEEVKLVLQNYIITINNDNMKKIAKVVKEGLPEEIIKKRSANAEEKPKKKD